MILISFSHRQSTFEMKEKERSDQSVDFFFFLITWITLVFSIYRHFKQSISIFRGSKALGESDIVLPSILIFGWKPFAVHDCLEHMNIIKWCVSLLEMLCQIFFCSHLQLLELLLQYVSGLHPSALWRSVLPVVAFGWMWAGSIILNTSALILLLRWAVTSSVNTSEPVLLAVIHENTAVTRELTQ